MSRFFKEVLDTETLDAPPKFIVAVGRDLFATASVGWRRPQRGLAMVLLATELTAGAFIDPWTM